MIRVLVSLASDGAGLEALLRSIRSLEFTGFWNPADPDSPAPAADVLLMETGDGEWTHVADLPIPVVLLVDSMDLALMGSALRAGIRGVIARDATADELEGAIQAVHAGLVVTPAGVLAELLPAGQSVVEELAEPLSDREREVLDLVAEGLSNKLIAFQLSISEHTVKTHVASIFAKLGVSSRTEAVSQAIRRGLVML